MKAKLLLGISAVILGLVALAWLGGSLLTSSAPDRAVPLVPDDAVVYGSINMDPSLSQKRALRDLVGEFPAFDDVEDARRAAGAILNEGLAPFGVYFESDVEPWLGSQVAFFVLARDDSTQPLVALLFDVDDPEGAEQLVDEIAGGTDSSLLMKSESHEGVGYYAAGENGHDPAVGIIEDFLLIGHRSALEASIAASSGTSLADVAAYSEPNDDLREDRLATLYVDWRQEFVSQTMSLERRWIAAAALGSFPSASVTAVHARDHGLLLDTSAFAPGPSFDLVGSELMGDLPGSAIAGVEGLPPEDVLMQLGAFLAGESPDADPADIEEAFDDRFGLDLPNEVLSWVGDVAVFIEGWGLRRTGPTRGAVIHATDVEEAADSLETLRTTLARDGAAVTPLDPRFGEVDGFALQEESKYEALYFVVAREKVFVVHGWNSTLAALGINPIEAPIPLLGETERFLAAAESLGPGFEPSAYLDVRRVFALDRPFLADDLYDRVNPFVRSTSS